MNNIAPVSNNKHFLNLSSFSLESKDLLSLNIFYVNINRLQNKLAELEILLSTLNEKIDIIILTETFLYLAEIKFFNMNGYKAYHSTRESRDGGGITMFVHLDLDFTLSKIEISLENEYVVLHSKVLNLHVTAFYKPPHTCHQIFLNLLEMLTNNYKNQIILGDFNQNLLDDSNKIQNYSSSLLINNYFVINQIDEKFATRISKTARTVIDHILSDHKEKFFIYYGDTELSDHRFFLVKFVLAKKSTKQIVQKLTVDYNKVIASISDAYQNLNNLNFDLFYRFVTYSIAKYTTNSTVNKKSSAYLKPWFNTLLSSKAKARNRLFRLSKKYPRNTFFREALESLNKEFKKLVHKYKKEYYTKKFNASIPNPKKMWCLVNEVLTNNSPKHNIIPSNITLNCDNFVITDQQQVVNKFNDYFVNVGLNLSGLSSSHQFKMTPLLIERHLTSLGDITEEEVITSIVSLKDCCAPGYDLVPTFLVKRLSNIIAPILTKSINEWTDQCIFPSCLKKSRVVPIFKSGDQRLITNYRPISLLSVFSKIFEMIIHKKLLDHFECNRIISKHQYGFTKNCNTVSATLNLIENIYQSIEEKNFSACLFLDIQKAFDCVNHSILLKKLFCYGITGKALKLIENYLTNREQTVKLNHYESTNLRVRCGVPQGSILGPTLFLAYINDIFELDLKGSLQLFADDAALIYNASSLTELKDNMEHDLKTLNDYLSNNSLKLNFAKTNYLIFYLKHRPQNLFDELEYMGDCIKRVDSIRYLGLIINSSLTWSDHILQIKRKTFPFIGVLRRVGYLIPLKLRNQLYFSYIHSNFTYLIQIWGAANPGLINDLQVIQNKAIKAIRHLPGLTPTKLLYDDHILPVVSLIDYEYLMTIYKIRHGLLKCNLLIQTNYSVTDKITRFSLNYRLPMYKFSTTQNSIFYKGLDIFNRLEDLKKDARISEFKAFIKNKLFINFLSHYNILHQ